MGIDHVIDLDCVPKQTLTTMGLLAKLKARQRAQTMIKLYRDRGDFRPPTEIGFEMVSRAADGSEHTEVVVVQTLLDEAAALDGLEQHCAHCPANLSRRPFGCFNFINYPISQKAEIWLLRQLPVPDEPLIFLLVQQVMQDLMMQADVTAQVVQMRRNPGVYFESGELLGRQYEEFTINTNHLFQLLFLSPSIEPRYGALLLLLFGAVQRDMDAETLMKMTPADPANLLPLLLQTDPTDDESVYSIKLFLSAVHRAHSLNVTLSLDA